MVIYFETFLLCSGTLPVNAHAEANILNAVVKSRDIPICKLLAKCREMISLVDFVRKSVTLHLLMNINELVLLP